MRKLNYSEWAEKAADNSLNGLVWSSSIHAYNGITYCLTKGLDNEYLVVFGNRHREIPQKIYGTEVIVKETLFIFAELNHDHAERIREIFHYTAPVSTGSGVDSFGVGDRLGLASTGHLRLFTRTNMIPVLAQQSLRELELTGRTFADVIDAATWAVFRSGYCGSWIADGDHLKFAADAVSALQQGCTMITADLSDHINYQYLDMSEAALLEAYSQLNPNYCKLMSELYSGNLVFEGSCQISFSPTIRALTVLVYKDAVSYALELYKACQTVNDSFDFEVSIDETETATSLEAHYFVAKELKRFGVPFISIAPRFVGEFQKGIDYIGDLAEFEENFANHAAIAGALGYKLSVHSASDKFSAYPAIARQLKGPMHIKTSGTNWLVALKVIAKIDPGLYRKLHAHAYKVFPVAKSYYHVTPDLESICDLSIMEDEELHKIFDNSNDRQVLHISYGEILKISNYKQSIYQVLESHIEDYWDELEQHIGRHIELLGKFT